MESTVIPRREYTHCVLHLRAYSTSSELITFAENVVILFAQIVIYHMLIKGKKNYVGIFGWNNAPEWVKNGHSNKKKKAEKTSLFFSSRG